MQEPLPPAAVPKDRWSGALVTERAESGLHHHLPDALGAAALHAPLRHAAVGLQRSPAGLRWRPRRRHAQGESMDFRDFNFFFFGVVIMPTSASAFGECEKLACGCDTCPTFLLARLRICICKSKRQSESVRRHFTPMTF